MYARYWMLKNLRFSCKQWEEREDKAQTCSSNKPEANEMNEQPAQETASPVQPAANGKEKDSAKAASETESQLFFQVTGINYRVYRHHRGTVNQLRTQEVDGKRAQLSFV
jgi:hypothetical protein